MIFKHQANNLNSIGTVREVNQFILRVVSVSKNTRRYMTWYLKGRLDNLEFCETYVQPRALTEQKASRRTILIILAGMHENNRAGSFIRGCDPLSHMLALKRFTSLPT